MTGGRGGSGTSAAGASGATGGGAGTGASGAGGSAASGGQTGSGGAGSQIPPPACKADITVEVLANANVTLTGDACVLLPAATTQYDGVISGAGTLTIEAPNGPGTLVVTGDSTFALPPAAQTESAAKTANYYTIESPNPPVVFVEPGATLQLGTSTSTSGTIESDLPNTGTTIINSDNIEVDGTLAMGGGPTEHFGILSGTGAVTQPGNPGPYTTGTFYLVGDDPFSGILSIATGGQVGDLGVTFSLPNARAIYSNGSMIMNSPPTFGYTLPQIVYEQHYGDDINTDHGLIVFAGVYSYSDSGDPINPSLDNPSLNTAVVTNSAQSPRAANGSNSSFRGINLEGGTTQWGDGTTSVFFLPSTPAPADPGAKNVKNAYINLRTASAPTTLVFDYNGRYTCNIGITGGGGGPHAGGDVGVGNVTLASTTGNYAVFTMPQNYNGTTTIGAGATLQLGNGGSVQALGATVGAATAAEPNGAVTTAVLATYSGDSSLLTAESSTGAATDNIVNNGAIVVDNTSTAITLSHITGSGTLTEIGPAAVTVLANNYLGDTHVRGGTLLAADDRALGRGNVTNDATLAATRGARVIAVGGNYRQGGRGTLRLTLRANGSNDLLRVAGHAELDGALAIQLAGRTNIALPVGRRFAVVRAAGGLTGRFRSAVAEGRTLAVSYDATTVYVAVPRKSARQALVAVNDATR
ncbi:MAG TPA: autotransporter [Polyangia bacterium]|nr:autotransporter [Polyangia bacterium]